MNLFTPSYFCVKFLSDGLYCQKLYKNYGISQKLVPNWAKIFKFTFLILRNLQEVIWRCSIVHLPNKNKDNVIEYDENHAKND